MNEAIKRCSKCGRDLPLSDFYKDRHKPDGMMAQCKQCHNEYKRGYRARGGGIYGAMRRFGKSPTKDNCRTLSKLLANSGSIYEPKACQGCGRDDVPLEIHHADYGNPWSVAFLCKGCHAAMDARRREREAAQGIDQTDGKEANPIDSDALTLKEYAKATGRSARSVYQDIDAGRIEGAVKHNGRWYIKAKP